MLSMVAPSTRTGVNGAIWLGSGAVVLLVRFFFHQSEGTLLVWVFVGVLMILVGIYQVVRFQRLKSETVAPAEQSPALTETR